MSFFDGTLYNSDIIMEKWTVSSNFLFLFFCILILTLKYRFTRKSRFALGWHSVAQGKRCLVCVTVADNYYNQYYSCYFSVRPRYYLFSVNGLFSFFFNLFKIIFFFFIYVYKIQSLKI